MLDGMRRQRAAYVRVPTAPCELDFVGLASLLSFTVAEKKSKISSKYISCFNKSDKFIFSKLNNNYLLSFKILLLRVLNITGVIFSPALIEIASTEKGAACTQKPFRGFRCIDTRAPWPSEQHFPSLF